MQSDRSKRPLLRVALISVASNVFVISPIRVDIRLRNIQLPMPNGVFVRAFIGAIILSVPDRGAEIYLKDSFGPRVDPVLAPVARGKERCGEEKTCSASEYLTPAVSIAPAFSGHIGSSAKPVCCKREILNKPNTITGKIALVDGISPNAVHGDAPSK